MNLGKHIRLNRIFSHPSGRLCSLAIDHFISYQRGIPAGLINVPHTLATLVPARPDAITMLKGMAKSAWKPYAGSIPLIIQAVYFTPDELVFEQFATPEEVIRLGADAIAVAIGVRGPNEGKFLKLLTDVVREADPLGLPVVAHIYPRDFSDGGRNLHDPESVFWAVRCGIECGADVIKVPFTGTVESYREIVSTSPVPVVAAGGPRCDTLREFLCSLAKIVESGARGATIGRNIWGMPNPVFALNACKAAIHDGLSAEVILANS